MCELMNVEARKRQMQFAGQLVDMASIAARYEKPEDLYAADGVHPSKAGTLLIANHIASLAGELLSSRRDAVSSLSRWASRVFVIVVKML